MGNCIDRQRAVTWVDDYDDYDEDCVSEESTSSKDDYSIDTNSGKNAFSASTELKLKITKKQLEKLLKRIDGRDLTVQEVLANLMSHHEDPDRHWKPALQSIPEVSE
ncbi:uncharacterized protein LOC109834825 [Asparagus officinalis]|nr:uncharacterized protein LOC109834825 [Asparagus officinalis]